MDLIKVSERGGDTGKIERRVEEEKAAGECNRSNINHKTNVD